MFRTREQALAALAPPIGSRVDKRSETTANKNSVDGLKRRIAKVKGEVERLLGCISEAADHYRVLDVDRDATTDRIRAAYCRAVELLHPLKCQDIIEVDGAMRWKLSEAFLRVVEAFSVLSSPGRRVEYDGLLNRRPIRPLPMPKLPEPRHLAAANSIAIDGNGDGSNRVGLGNAFGYAEVNAPRVKDRRRAARLIMKLPVRVSSYDSEWQEVTESCDVSRSGILFRLSTKPTVGTQYVLELPMPLAFRNHGHSSAMYVVRAVVRYAVSDNGGFLVGAEFQDETPAVNQSQPRQALAG